MKVRWRTRKDHDAQMPNYCSSRILLPYNSRIPVLKLETNLVLIPNLRRTALGSLCYCCMQYESWRVLVVGTWKFVGFKVSKQETKVSRI